MRAIRWTPVVLLLSIALAGCNSSNSDMGVGPDLYTASLPENTKAQNDYVAAICTQAGGQVIQLANSVDCSAPDGWSAFVQAGMNDIDARCDAYLVWLDQRKRRAKPILKQIGDTQDATTAIVGIAYPGSNAITILTQVFALAKNTFENVNNGLLLEVDHSTVQAVVLRRQKEFRDAILGRTVGNRPAAMYALRSYLRICMPITIATDINTTITGLERGDRAPDPLIDGGSVAAAMTASRPLPPTPQPTIVQLIPGAVTAAERALNRADFIAIQESLCLAGDGAFGSQTRDGIRIYERAEADPAANGELSQSEVQKLLRYAREMKACARQKFGNYFERKLFDRQGGDALVRVLQEKLNANDKPGAVPVPVTGQLDDATRKKIKSVREFKQLPRESDVLSMQVTPDLLPPIDFQ